MFQRQIVANRQNGPKRLAHKTRPAPAHRLTGAMPDCVWEWDCFVKSPIINICSPNSSQSDTFRHFSYIFYTLPSNLVSVARNHNPSVSEGTLLDFEPSHPVRDLEHRSQTQLCQPLAIGLFRKIRDNSYIPTQFIIIRHNPTHFEPIFGPPARHTRESEIQHPASNTRHADR
jgi:hypothetical protein